MDNISSVVLKLDEVWLLGKSFTEYEQEFKYFTMNIGCLFLSR